MKNVIATVALVAILICLIWTSQLSEGETKVALLISLILAISSAVVSWIISASFSTKSIEKENSQMVDRIGEQSSEKILNQSKQLYCIEQYLDDKYDKLEDKEYDIEGLAYLESARNMIRLIRSSNNTYLSDWAGVVSKGVKEKIITQSNAQSQLFEDIDLIHYSTPEKRDKLEEKIEENSSKLPSHLVPKSGLKGNSAKIVNHEIIEDIPNRKKGKVSILLSEESFKGHVVAKFASNFNLPPNESSSRLIKSPYEEKMNINVFAKTGTIHDFHIGIKSNEYNIPLKQGIYEVEYEFLLND